MAEVMKDSAADGTGIGEVSAMPTAEGLEFEARPATFDEATGLVKKLESAMDPEAVLEDVSKANSDVVDRLLPHYSDTGLRLQAIELYVTGEYSIPMIANKVGVPERTVAKWAEVGNWIRFNESLVDTMKRHEKVRIATRRIQEREKAIDEQIELGHKIAEEGKRFIDEAETPGQFKMAAEGVKLGSDMVGRALAISETGKVDQEQKSEGASGGAVPLVMVFKGNGGLPPMPEGTEVIDVKC